MAENIDCSLKDYIGLHIVRRGQTKWQEKLKRIGQ